MIVFCSQSVLDSLVARGAVSVHPIDESDQPSTPDAPTTPPAASAVLSPQKLTVNGLYVECEKYNIGGSNFFQLRELGSILGFEVGYDEATNTAIVQSVQK